MNMGLTVAISKLLSVTDTGENGCHQAGMLVPKEKEILSFFPALDASVKNPRCRITVTDSFDQQWSFNFIYYNGAHFDRGKNEYRLTGMTKFFRAHNVKAGDEIVFTKNEHGQYFVKYKAKSNVSDDGRLKLKGSWKIVSVK